MAPLPPTDVATHLWGRTRREAAHLPVTAPHGFVCLVPGATPRTDGPWSNFWITDGDTLAHNGTKCSLEEVRRRMERDLAEGEMRLPFRVQGHVFYQVVQRSSNRYGIALVDPGWLDPVERTVMIRPQVAGAWSATDRQADQSASDGGGRSRGRERSLEQLPWSAIRDKPPADAFGYRTRRGLAQLGGVLAIAANPIPLSNTLADKLDAVCPPSAFLQADADVSGKSGRFLTFHKSQVLRN
ncbi:MAG TPA: hypothetical protein PLF81_04815 [Candidatus Anammoximicrobium sp.]|nr:hypothetical protein [Candidatus Anammoximicrobium sp.]